MGCVCLVAWLAARPYQGIVLDAQLYALQAMAVLNPFPLANDIFLRFGSQSNFTLFPHIVAPLLARFGLESAAAAIVVTSSLTLLGGGWLLSRSLFDARVAWLSLGLLIVIPGWYGGCDVFRYDEMYLNARVPAEALSILAVCLACRNSWWYAAIFAALAAAIHPVMAAPAWGLLTLLLIDSRATAKFGDRAAAYVALGGTVAVALASLAVSSAPIAAHDLWLETLRSGTSYAFLQNWTLNDWLQNALGLASLLISATALESRTARRLAACCCMVGLIGLALAALTSVGRGFDLLLLAQPWRWMSLCRFVAVVLIPATLRATYRRDVPGRSSALLLGTGWALFNYAGGAVAFAAAAIWLAGTNLRGEVQSALLKGAYVIACAGALMLLGFGLQAIPLDFDNNVGPVWGQRLIDIAGLDGPPVLAMTLAWWLTMSARWRIAPLAVGVGAAAALPGWPPASTRASTSLGIRQCDMRVRELARGDSAVGRSALVRRPSGSVDDARTQELPVGQPVGGPALLAVCDDRVRPPQPVVVIARQSRVLNVAEDSKPDYPKRLSAGILHDVCEDPTLAFVVSGEEIPGYVRLAEWPGGGHYVFLYDCRQYRRDSIG